MDPCQILVLAVSARTDDDSQNDVSSNHWGLPTLNETVPDSFSALPHQLHGCGGLITELMESQRNLPLLS